MFCPSVSIAHVFHVRTSLSLGVVVVAVVAEFRVVRCSMPDTSGNGVGLGVPGHVERVADDCSSFVSVLLVCASSCLFWFPFPQEAMANAAPQ